MKRPRRPWPVVAALVATVAYAWWTAGLRPFTWPPLLAVGVAGIAAIVIGTSRRDSSPTSGQDRRGVLVWGILFALLAGWELAAYLQHPRADHPTLSSLAGHVIDWRPARAVAFLVWLAAGTGLARR